jgi:hypothetical protein
MLEQPLSREPGCLPTLIGLALATIVGIFALPILWFWGSKDNRTDRLVGFAFGLVLNPGFVIPILVVLNE